MEGGCREPERAPLSGGKLALWVAFASLAGIGVSMIGQIFAMVELNFLYEIGFPYYSPDFSTGGYTLLDTILCNLYICVLGPVLEELIFRGFMLRALQRHGSAFAVIFTSVMFMLFHMNLCSCLPAFNRDVSGAAGGKDPFTDPVHLLPHFKQHPFDRPQL